MGNFYYVFIVVWTLVVLANTILLSALFFATLICDWIPSIRCWIDCLRTKLYDRKHHKNQILVKEGKGYRWVDINRA